MSGHTIANYSKNVIYIIIVPWTHTLMRKLCISNFKRHWSICSLGMLEVQFHLDEPESQCLSLARGIPGTRILSAIKWKMVQEYIQNRPQFYQELKREIPFILMESSALDFNISNVSSTKVQSEHLRLGSHTNVFFVCRIILCCCPFLLFVATGRQRVRKEVLSWLSWGIPSICWDAECNPSCAFSGTQAGGRHPAPARVECWAQWEEWDAASREKALGRGC